MTPEGKVKVKIKKILKRHKCWYCMPNTHGYGRSGVQDFIVCHRGVFLAIEAKAAGGKLTDLQTIERDGVLKAGGWGLKVGPEELEALDGLLETIKGIAGKTQQQFDAAYEEGMTTPGEAPLNVPVNVPEKKTIN